MPLLDDSSIEVLLDAFEKAAHVNEQGVEFWYARELQPLLGYTTWRRFVTAIEKAQIACEAAGHKAPDHFADAGKMVGLGKRHDR